MYDRRTRSLWSQVNGTAIAGVSEGASLEEIVSTLTSWGEWRSLHPETLVLKKPTLERSPYERYHDADWVGLPWFRSRDKRLPAKTLVLGVESVAEDGIADRSEPTRSAALVLKDLSEKRVFAFTLDGDRLLAVMSSVTETPRLFRVPEDRAIGSIWHVTSEDNVVEERSEGLSWDWRTGRPIAGAAEAPPLEPLSASPIYWGIWSRFHPDTVLVLGGGS